MCPTILATICGLQIPMGARYLQNHWPYSCKIGDEIYFRELSHRPMRFEAASCTFDPPSVALWSTRTTTTGRRDRNGMAFAMPSLALPYLPWYARGARRPRRRGSLSGPESSYSYSPRPRPRPVMDGGVPRLHCKAHHAFIPCPVAQTQNGRKMAQ